MIPTPPRSPPLPPPPAGAGLAPSTDPVAPTPNPEAQDYLAKVRRQQSLIQTGALQSAIFNSVNFSSIATDTKGVIQIFNVGAAHMLGYTAMEVMDKITPADFSDPRELIMRASALSVELGVPISPGFDALVFKASRGIEDIYELTYIRRDGSRFPAMVSVTALRDAQDGIIGYLLIGTDNTARKQAEVARAKVEAQSNDAQQMEALETFASGIAHDFNNALAAIIGNAELARRDVGLGHVALTSLDEIDKSSQRAKELVKQILAFGRQQISPPSAELTRPGRSAPIPARLARDDMRQHVLYVDDDAAIIFLMTRLLERQGYRVSGFKDPLEALAAVHAQPHLYDLAVTDYNMPDMSGLDLANAVRKIRPDLPVVLASGHITDELRVQAPLAGIRELIYKPNMVEDLCKAVARQLQIVAG